MLRDDSETVYQVHPSWAIFDYKWEELAHLLAHPLESGYLDPSEPWEKWGFALGPQQFQLIDGPCGGGIISHHITDKKWLPGIILTKDCNSPVAPGMGTKTAQAVRPKINVRYFEPFFRPLYDALEGKPHRRLYLCGCSTEHLESDPDSLYWVIRLKKSRREIEGLSDVPQWAFHFDLHASRLPVCPDHLLAETAEWFSHPDRQYVWYKVENYQPKVGLNFAIVVYLGLHLAKVAGKRMVAMHMLSGIEGKPNICKNWGWH